MATGNNYFIRGVPNAPSSSLLRAQTSTSFDNLGRVYQELRYSVNPSTGSVGGNTLDTEYYYDSRGDLIETIQPNAPVVKDAYNGLGQLIAEYETDGAGGTSYSAASSVSSDTVLSQTEYSYDADGNVIETTTS